MTGRSPRGDRPARFSLFPLVLGLLVMASVRLAAAQAPPAGVAAPGSSGADTTRAEPLPPSRPDTLDARLRADSARVERRRERALLDTLQAVTLPRGSVEAQVFIDSAEVAIRHNLPAASQLDGLTPQEELEASLAAARAAAKDISDDLERRFDGSKLIVTQLDLDGADQLGEGGSKAVMVTRKRTFIDIVKTPFFRWIPGLIANLFGRHLPPPAYQFNFPQFRLDLVRLQRHYNVEGFRQASVDAFNLDESKGKVKLTIRLTERQPTVYSRVARVVVDSTVDRSQVQQLPATGLPIGVMDDDVRQRIGDGVQVGQRVTTPPVGLEESALNTALRNRGYPYAQVQSDLVIDDSTHTAQLTYMIEPGPQSVYGQIRVEGAEKVRGRAVERHLGVREGQLYRQDQVDFGQRRLYGLQAFRFVRVALDTTAGEPLDPNVPLLIRVQEAPMRALTGQIGFGTDEYVRGALGWTHRNLFNDARQFSATARGSAKLVRGELQLKQPYFLNNRTELTLVPLFGQIEAIGESHLYWEKLGSNGRTYFPKRTSAGASVLVNRIFNERSFASLGYGYTVNREVNANPDSATRRRIAAFRTRNVAIDNFYTASALTGELRYATTNDVFSPTRGFVVSARAGETGLIIQSEHQFARLVLDGRYYKVIFGRNRILALRVKPSFLQPIRSNTVPLAERFFAGGSSSIRGWGLNEISPEVAVDTLYENITEGDQVVGRRAILVNERIGGNLALEANTEVRVPLFGQLTGLVFADAGNVWADRASFKACYLLYSPGVGLRYSPPLGPVGFDVGYKLNTLNYHPGRRIALHINIGYAF